MILRRNAMKVELKCREKSEYKLLCSSQSSSQLSEEIIVPDTMEDIQRILCCRQQCRIREKNVRQDAVSISGELDATVLYVPESGEGIRFISSTFPFEVTFDTAGADSTTVSVSRITGISIDARASNPRKVAINAVINMEQSCYKYADMSWTEAPDTVPEKMFFKTASAQYKSITLAGEKSLSLEDELQLPESVDGGEFVKAFTTASVEGSEIVGSKLVVKGRMDIEALYIVSDTLQPVHFYLAFSQLFTLPDEPSATEVSATAMVTGQYFESFENKLSADIRAVVQVVCVQEQSIDYVSDAYSCRKALELNKSDLEIINGTAYEKRSVSVLLTYSSDYGISSVSCSHTVLSKPELSDDEGKVLVPVYVDVIYTDADGALRSCRARGRAEVELSGGFEHIYAACTDCSVSFDGNTVSANVSICLESSTVSKSKLSVISEVDELEEELARNGAAAYMCRWNDSDLWDAAKKFGSDVELIKRVNGLETSEPDGRLLLIPVI